MEYSESYQVSLRHGFHMRPSMKACDFMEEVISKNEGLEFTLEKESGEIWKSEREPSFLDLMIYATDLLYKTHIKVTTSGNFPKKTLRKYNHDLGEFFKKRVFRQNNKDQNLRNNFESQVIQNP